MTGSQSGRITHIIVSLGGAKSFNVIRPVGTIDLTAGDFLSVLRGPALGRDGGAKGYAAMPV